MIVLRQEVLLYVHEILRAEVVNKNPKENLLSDSLEENVCKLLGLLVVLSSYLAFPFPQFYYGILNCHTPSVCEEQ